MANVIPTATIIVVDTWSNMFRVLLTVAKRGVKTAFAT
jgi:uncharacterized SAM-binding protein YcdF (DUF218 family)